MASFRVHISFGVAAGVLFGMTALGSEFNGEPGLVFALAGLTVIGSVLPDMDSDSGVPFHIAFGSLSIICSSLVFYYLIRGHQMSLGDVLLRSFGAGAFVWLVLGNIFKRFTAHRGITHSIPVAVLLGLITFFIANNLTVDEGKSFVLGVAMITGFLLHLILDEIWAAFNFNGVPFIPNKALGSALKLFSDNMLINFLVYGAIIFLSAGNWKHFLELGKEFWSKIQL
jgi:membrane-bound metal-dependent hydrolase YbcI (DUF457 family)